MSKLGDKIAKDKNNIIVVPYQGESFVTKLVNQLANSKYSDDDSLVVYGMHNWLNIDVLDMGDLDTLNFHFASNEFVNYSDSCTKSFIKKYRYNYYTEPSYYALQGFDIAYFYLSELKKFGTGFKIIWAMEHIRAFIPPSIFTGMMLPEAMRIEPFT